MALCSIKNVEGVNALKAGQSLEFSPQGITVVYGDNGSGKSGYIRIVKQISNARYKDDIKGNVYKRTNATKKCEISIINNDKEEKLLCNLNHAGQHEVLRNIDVFDTKISKAYVETAKEASYEPWIFSMFSEIANITTVIKEKLEEKKKQKPLIEIKIPEEVVEEPQLKILTEYTNKTKINEKEYEWKDSDEIELQELIKQSNEDILSAQIKHLSGSISSIEALIIELKKFNMFYSKENIAHILKLKEQWHMALDKKKAAMLLFQSQALDIDKESVANSAWVALWQSAKKYYEDVLIVKKEIKYDIEDGLCPLCRQKIHGQVLKRIQSIEEYINGTTSNEEKTCRDLYVSVVSKLYPCWSEEVAEKNLNSCDIQNTSDYIKDVFKIIRDDYFLLEQRKYNEIVFKSLDIDVLINQLIEIKNRRIKEKESKNQLLKNETHIAMIKKSKSCVQKK